MIRIEYTAEDQKRVSSAYNQGVNDFTQDDLRKVMKDEATAQKKAGNPGE